MKIVFLALCLMTAPICLAQYLQPDCQSLPAVLIEQAPIIDGDLSDICWEGLTSASGFTQKTPKEGQPSIESTAVKVCYDREYLYFAFYCQAKQPGKITSRLIPREDGNYGDIVIILLDTYNDKRGAYKLFINPKGIQGDAYLSEDGANSDLSWNGVWSSTVKTDTDGWTAELAVPFKNLRFSAGENQTWGINFGRYIACHNEVSYWQPVTKQEGYPRISKCGKLCGLSGIKPGRNLEILPYGLGRTEKFSDQRISEGKLGLDAKWAPTTNMAWDITLNPDFAQIEADPQNINLSKYETYLPERRPFFIERADLFNAARLSNFSTGPTWKPFYSRRIGKKLPDGQLVPILWGSKLTGKSMGTTLGAIMARTGGLDYDDYGTPATEPYASFSVLRLRQDIFSSSTIGLLGVNRTVPGDVNSVAVADANITAGRFKMAGAFARSLNQVSGLYGNLGDVSLNWDANFYQLFFGLKDIGRNFDIKKFGYQGDAGYKTWAAGGGIKPDLSNIGISSLWAGLFYGRGKQYRDDKYGDGCSFNFDFSTVNAWGFWAGMDVNRGYIEDVWQKTMSYWAGINSDGRKILNGGFNFSQNDAYNYEWDYFGHTRTLDLWSGLNILSNLSFSVTAGNIWQYHQDWDYQRADLTSGQRLQYSLTRDIALRVFVQQNTSDHSHNFNGLISWSFAPGSMFYLAYNEARDNSFGNLTLQSRTIVAKISYLWSL